MIETIRKLGILTKGFVYTLVGLLTLMAALEVGGKVSDKQAAITFLEDQTFGQVLLLLIALGLVLFSLWRLASAFLNSKNEEKDKIGYAKRIGYFISGLLYAALGISSFLSISNSNNGSSDIKANLVSLVLEQGWGNVVMYLVAVILFFVGIFQFVKGYEKEFLDELKLPNDRQISELVKRFGTFGYMARGISFAIFAWFVAQAAYQNNPDSVRGLEGMFNFLEQLQMGNLLMGVMAAGFIAYGVFQYFLARHSRMYA